MEQWRSQMLKLIMYADDATLLLATRDELTEAETQTADFQTYWSFTTKIKTQTENNHKASILMDNPQGTAHLFHTLIRGTGYAEILASSTWLEYLYHASYSQRLGRKVQLLS